MLLYHAVIVNRIARRNPIHPTSRQPAHAAPHHQNYDAMLCALHAVRPEEIHHGSFSGPECSFLDRTGTRQPRTQIRNWHYVRGRGGQDDQVAWCTCSFGIGPKPQSG